MNSNDRSGLLTPRSLSPYSQWRVAYKPTPTKPESKGIWDGYQTHDEFISMHLR